MAADIEKNPFEITVSNSGKQIMKGKSVLIATGALTRLTSNRAPESQPRWSRDGKLLAFAAAGTIDWELRNSKLWILDVATRQIRLASGSFEGGVSGFEWNPDQKSVLFDGGNGLAQRRKILPVERPPRI